MEVEALADVVGGMTEVTEVSDVVAAGDVTAGAEEIRTVLALLSGGLRLQKAPFPCHNDAEKPPDGTFRLRDTNSIQPCKQNKLVIVYLAAFLTSF